MLGVRLLNGATQHRIMIFGPKDDGTYVVEFRTAWNAVLSGGARLVSRAPAPVVEVDCR